MPQLLPTAMLPALLMAGPAMSALERVWEYLNRQFTVGKITVSVTSFLIGLLILVLALLVSRTLSRVIERRIAKREYIDPGIRYTVARLIHYVILVIGVLFALRQAFSLDLTSIAVVFTALSVGIGFGLQHIASDIAAGFVLLFERPIRVGDRVTIGEDEGDIHSINLRTTVVMTNDRIALIVPNSSLVRERVVNWSYGDPRARLAIPVSVAPDSDVDLVTRTLEKVPESLEDILRQPQPKVQFLTFGDSSLDFRLLVWTNKPRSHVQIKSDINYRIARLFRERNIRIPYPTQEFLLKGVDLPKDQEPNLLHDRDAS